MATDNRMPDDLQEAVAATLRRLRGEVRSQASAVAPAVQHSEPLFSSPRPEPTLPPVSALENLAAPDLLAGAGPDMATAWRGTIARATTKVPASRIRTI